MQVGTDLIQFEVTTLEEVGFVLCESCKCAPRTLFTNESITPCNRLVDPKARPKIHNNYCFYIYLVVMLVTSLGGCGAWVQCKHLYHILQNIMYCGQSKKFIHYPTWSWDKVQWLLHVLKHLRAHDIIIKLYLH
jgi:hypothetical protein